MGEWIGLFIMASALGMDAFSVSLGMGMFGLRLMQIARVGFMIGLFHLIMPLLGMIVGRFLSVHFEFIATLLGAGLLLLIGIHMVLHSIFHKGESAPPLGWGLLFLSFSVSVDSFSAGISLGMLGAEVFVTVGMIALLSVLFSWCGLFLGAKFNSLIGPYGALFGGLVLIGFGVELLFN